MAASPRNDAVRTELGSADPALHERWRHCKEVLRTRLDADEALAWLPGLALMQLSADRAIVTVPNAFFQQRILRQFAPLLRRSLLGAFAEFPLAEDFTLDLRVGAEPPERPTGQDARRPLLATAHLAGQMELFSAPEDASPGRDSEMTRPAAVEAPPHPSFASFQAGEENRAAWSLAREVAAAPGKYNPFLLVGNSGTGKSHLLGAIAREAAAAQPAARIVLCSAEQFTVDVLDGIRRKSMPTFRERYRGADWFLLDDLEFLEVTAKAQEELLHTFEALLAAGKQMVFAAGRPLAELLGLGAALRSRLEAGLRAELTLPRGETRLAIARGFAARAGLAIAEPELVYLARGIGGSPRRLEGALVRIGAHASMLDVPIDESFVRDLAAPWLDPVPGARALVPPTTALAAVRAEFGMTERQLRSRDRSRQRDLARQMAMRLMRERGGLSYGEIGRLLGNRAHSSVVEGIAALERKLARQPALMQTWTRLLRRIDAAPDLTASGHAFSGPAARSP